MWPTTSRSETVLLRFVDADGRSPVVVVTARLAAGDHTVVGLSDTSGVIQWTGVPRGVARLHVEALGFESLDVQIDINGQPSSITLKPQPLLMDEMVVRGVRDADHVRTPVFVESLSPAQISSPGADVAQVLQSATGVRIRRYGGLGSASTVSVRGSTSDQVQIYLDGIPLNRAGGGGVDLGSLPVAGVESIDVYRGAVPARFGGNSLGGVLHLRTRSLGGQRRWRVQSSSGSFGTRQVNMSASMPFRALDLMVLADVNHSDNDFRFFDDNGTEYNQADDGWVRRRNSDFTSLRTIAKVGRRGGTHRWQVHDLHDASHKGLPGIGNFQSLHSRFDTWRNLTEALFYGPLSPTSAYRLRAYHSLERGTFKDLRGEVGAAQDHDQTTTRGIGLHGEYVRHMGNQQLATLFLDARQERFDGEDLLQDGAPEPNARRRVASVGGELESPLGYGLTAHIGGQWEGFDDRFFDDGNFVPAAPFSPFHDQRGLWGARGGLSADLGWGWSLKTHVGRYVRAPGFFELFGDRGAIVGNTDLTPETGWHRDAGLQFRGRQSIRTIEIVAYDNRVEDLIRFVQNSQFVSRAHNIGEASLRGIETRAEGRLGLMRGISVSLRSAYTYQRAENRSAFTFEKGNDLPNAPRHHVQVHSSLNMGPWNVHWDLRREGRHYLDRANLRTVPARTIQGMGLRARLGLGLSAALEIRNLTDNQVADLWGYPLPGRTVQLSLSLEYPSALISHVSR